MALGQKPPDRILLKAYHSTGRMKQFSDFKHQGTNLFIGASLGAEEILSYFFILNADTHFQTHTLSRSTFA